MENEKSNNNVLEPKVEVRMSSDKNNNNVPEPKVEFRMFSDRMWLKIVSEDPNVSEPYAIISGYDLTFNFNFKLINSLEDVETVVGGLADMFREKLLGELLGNKTNSQE